MNATGTRWARLRVTIPHVRIYTHLARAPGYICIPLDAYVTEGTYLPQIEVRPIPKSTNREEDVALSLRLIFPT